MFRSGLTALMSSFVLIGLLPDTAYAQLCKYVDEDGRVTYSNVSNTPPKGAKKEKCFEAPPSQPRSSPSTSSSSVSTEQFPSVDEDTQKQRDDGRRSILENELAQEQAQLTAGKRALTEGEAVRYGDEKNYQKYLDRIQKLKDNVSLHEKNVNALNQELANLK